MTLRIDADVIEWFKGQGAGYQTRMNAVLRGFVEAQKNQAADMHTRWWQPSWMRVILFQ